MDQPSPYSDSTSLDVPIQYRLAERRVYLASALPNRDRVREVAAQLARDGVEIVSTWHARDDATVEGEAQLDRHERVALAEACLAEIDSADAVVWLHGHAGGRVGAAVEVGYALARGRAVLALSLDGAPPPSVFGALCTTVTVPLQLPLLVVAPVRVRAIARLSPEQRARNVARSREILAAIEATPDWRGRRSRP